MRAKQSMVQGGPIKRSMLDDYASYLRRFVEAYAAEGIPIYAITLQNERLFEPTDYPGMVISWELERDLLIEVHNNFRSVDGAYGPQRKAMGARPQLRSLERGGITHKRSKSQRPDAHVRRSLSTTMVG